MPCASCTYVNAQPVAQVPKMVKVEAEDFLGETHIKAVPRDNPAFKWGIPGG